MMSQKGLCIFFVYFVCLVSGHNWFTNPVSRGDQKDTQTGCRYGDAGKRQVPTCSGPCDRNITNLLSYVSKITVQRGQVVALNWDCHTHPGGFIRFAWSPFASSDAHSSFDSMVDLYVCKEIGGCSTPAINSGNPAPTGSSSCGLSYTIPLWLTDGAWTLQWAYFGGWLDAGDYYACVDYTVSGGPSGTQTTPVFKGGDYTYPNDNKCRFFTTQALHTCTYEPCSNGTLGTGVESSGAPMLFTASRTLVPITTVGQLSPAEAAATGSSSAPTSTPCTQDSDCKSGVCQVNGFCYVKSHSIGSGAIAAIVFAMLVVVVVGAFALFMFMNKSEIPFMRPFKGHA